MQLEPRYGDAPILRLDGDPSAIFEPLVRQNERLGNKLATLTDEQWAAGSRCEKWTVRDVIVHLGITNQFWTMSVAAGVAGEPTRMLEGFDPATTPLALGAGNDDSSADVLEQFLQASAAWRSTLEGLSSAYWEAQAEAPPGHLSVSAVAHHALWDSWVHERDILLPLGETPVQESDEVLSSLRYAMGLSASFEFHAGAGRTGEVGFLVNDPAGAFTLTVDNDVSVAAGCSADSLVLEANAVALLEGISRRAPMPVEVGPDVAWLFEGLQKAFDQ